MQETVTQDRERFLGGSDEPAIMGISPFTTRFELLQYKAGVVKNEFEGNEYTEYGNIMEGKIRDYINATDYDFIEDMIILSDSETLPTRYHADGVDHEQGIVLEVKTTSVIHEKADEYKYYLVQLLKGMYAFGYKEGMLAVYKRPDDMSEEFDSSRLQIFFIGMEDYESLMEEILKADENFREDYKAMVEMPWIDDSSLPSRAWLMPMANQIMALEGGIAEAQAIVKQYDELKKELCKQMEKHGVKSWTMPNGTKVTLVPHGEDSICKAFDTDSFKKEHEDLYDEYTIDKIKRGKSAYVRITPLAKDTKD